MKEGIAEMLNVHMCLISRICVNKPDAGATGYFVVISNIYKLTVFRLSKKTSMSQNRIFNALLESTGGATHKRTEGRAPV